jgi:Kef-type K+ transport system membrane component KefB
MRRAVAGVVGLLFMPVGAAEAMQTAAAAADHMNSVGPVLFGLIILLLAAKIGGDLLERLGQPAVLGELLFGVIIGNLALVGYHGLEYLHTNPALEFLAELGVILLLFEVGLESDLLEMIKIGPAAFLVAVLGVVAPFVLGWTVTRLMMPDLHMFATIFIGATLCATSVGITARVMRDLGVTRSLEGRIILGAAVIDDVLGLVILAVASGLVGGGTAGGGVPLGTVLVVMGKAVIFLGLAIWLGRKLSPRLFRVASRLRAGGMLISTALLGCFTLAYIADLIGLAGIVGAFAAGLVMEEVHYREFRSRGEHTIVELMRPITAFLAPVFFVRMGLGVDVTVFTDPEVVGFALAVTLAAIVGKQVCSAGAVGTGPINRLSIGLGMIPRGEVGLIFAGVGRALHVDGVPVLNDLVFSALVAMVMITTLVTPPLLRVAFVRGGWHK